MAIITTNEKYIMIDGTSIPKNSFTITTIENGVIVAGSDIGKLRIMVSDTTIDGNIFDTAQLLHDALNQYSFKDGGSAGGDGGGVTETYVRSYVDNAIANIPPNANSGVQSLRGDIVDNTDEKNPIVSLPTNLVTKDGQNRIMVGEASDPAHAMPLSQLNTALDTKVDKVDGKGLSTNDFTTAYQTKLDNVEDPLFLGSYPNIAALRSLTGTRRSGEYAYVQGVDGEGNPIVYTYQWVVLANDWEILQGASNSETPTSVKQKYEANANTNSFTDAEKAKLAGIQAGAQVNDPLTQIPTLDQVVKRNRFTDSSFHLSVAEKGRVGLEDVPGIGICFSADRNDNSGFLWFDGTNWLISNNVVGTNRVFLKSNGRIQVTVAPISGDDLTNRTYVDSVVGNVPMSNTVVNGVRIKEFTDRFEYTVKHNTTQSLTANGFATVATAIIFPAGVTISSVDEHYISIRNNSRSAVVSVYDASGRININYWNLWSGAITVDVSIFIKLIKYK